MWIQLFGPLKKFWGYFVEDSSVKTLIFHFISPYKPYMHLRMCPSESNKTIEVCCLLKVKITSQCEKKVAIRRITFWGKTSHCDILKWHKTKSSSLQNNAFTRRKDYFSHIATTSQKATYGSQSVESFSSKNTEECSIKALNAHLPVFRSSKGLSVQPCSLDKSRAWGIIMENMWQWKKDLHTKNLTERLAILQCAHLRVRETRNGATLQ